MEDRQRLNDLQRSQDLKEALEAAEISLPRRPPAMITFLYLVERWNLTQFCEKKKNL